MVLSELLELPDAKKQGMIRPMNRTEFLIALAGWIAMAVTAFLAGVPLLAIAGIIGVVALITVRVIKTPRTVRYGLELDHDRKASGWGIWYWIIDLKETDEAKRRVMLLDSVEAPIRLAEMNSSGG